MEVGSGEYVTKPVYDVPKNWGRELTGRRVDFGKPGEGEGLSWGIEVSIPIDDKIRKDMKNAGYLIPDKITTIQFLDLRPQESLPKKLRNIESNHDEKRVTLLEKIADTTVSDNTTLPFEEIINLNRPSRTLTRLLDSVFVFNKDKVREFNNQLQQSTGSKLVIVDGHAGGDPLELGEYDWQKTVDSEGNIIQKSRNAVAVDDILERYNKQGDVSGIVLHSCNKDNAEIRPRNFTIAHSSGYLGESGKLSSLYAGTKTVVVPAVT